MFEGLINYGWRRQTSQQKTRETSNESRIEPLYSLNSDSRYMDCNNRHCEICVAMNKDKVLSAQLIKELFFICDYTTGAEVGEGGVGWVVG